MGHSILHPRTDELVSYQFSSDLESRKRMESHLKECDSCTQTLSELEALRAHLVASPHLEASYVEPGHLSDELIVAYVNSSPNDEGEGSNNAYVQSHIEECGGCMKAVLRYRAHRASLLNSRTNDVEDRKVSVTSPRPVKARAWWKGVIDLVNWKIPVWAALPLAAVSALVVAIAFPLKAILDVGGGDGAVINAGYEQNISVPRTSLLQVGASQGNLINWYDGYAETTAIGTADMSKAVNSIQAELLAKKAAKHIAYANLSETINGLSINAKATYRDLITEVDALQTESQGFIRGGRVIREAVEWISGEPKATVTVRIPLFGNKGVQGLVERAKIEQAIEDGVTTVNNTANAAMTAEYDGVVIDARGLQYSPALQVLVVSPENEEIYKASTGLVPVDSAATAVRYYPSVEDAVDSLLFGGNPMVVKASKSPGSGVLVVAKDDASALLQLRDVVKRYRDRNRMAVVF